LIGKLEDHVVEIKDNAIKAEKEINEAEKDTRRITRKLVYLFIFVAIVVVAIIATMLVLFLPSSS
jgi:t-SNARE complex subunit (syntaxin)